MGGASINRRLIKVALFLALVLFMPIRPVSPQVTVTHTLTLPPASKLPGPPCLTPTQADVSTAQIQPTQQNVTINGHLVPNIHNETAQKAMLPDSTILHLALVLKLRQEAEFQQCLATLNDPTSPNYGHFLNTSMLEPYVPTPGQKESVATFMRERGFNVTYGPSPIVLELSSKASTITATFGLRLRLYQQGKRLFYAPDSEPRMPQSLGALVTAVTGLDNYTTVRPAETPCGSSGNPYCPQDVQLGYGFPNLFSSGRTGAGETVAIVDAPGDPNMQTAIDTYDTQYGLASTTLNIQTPSGSISWDPSWAAETALDVEAVHSAAPGASIMVVYDTTDLMNSVDYVASNHLAPIALNSWVYACNSGVVTPSYAQCSDTELPSALVSSVDTRLSLDTAQGLTILFVVGGYGCHA